MQQSTTTRDESGAPSPLKPPLPGQPAACLRWSRLYGSARGLAIVQAARRASGPVLVITADVRAALQIEQELRFFAAADAGLPILPFPDWESLPYDAFSPHQDLISQRLEALYRLPGLQHGIILAAAGTLMHRLAPLEYVAAHSFMLARGERLDAATFRVRLAAASYQAVSQVMQPGEYAIRGGLIDLFPMGSDRPYRIDLFGEEVESIREFDPDTQRSGETLEAVELLPAREVPLTDHAIQRFRQAFRATFEGDPQRVPLYRDVSNGIHPPGVEYYLPLFFETTASFFDYLPAATVCILDQAVWPAAQTFQSEAQERYEQLRHDTERPILPPAQLFIDAGELRERLRAHARIELLAFKADESETAADHNELFAAAAMHAFDAEPPPQLPVDPRADAPYAGLVDYLKRSSARILLVAETLGRRETLRGLLQEHGVRPTMAPGWADFIDTDMRLGLTVGELERGLLLRQPRIAVITESQLYGERAAQRRRRTRRGPAPEAVIRSLAELKPGDPVVHEDHGVGRYLGLQTLDVGDGPTEFLTLEYAGGDKLYIPVVALHLISRYTGTDAEHAPLHKLGGEAWERAKRRARKKAHDAAAELLKIYAMRAARKGHAFPVHSTAYDAFASQFPFEETPDQYRAIEEVLADMASAKSMERLVCGDVGFGKTEVALRAAFIAVEGGRQVAVLVPTTLLAQQHYQNFCDRFAEFPMKIELLSRFRSQREQSRVLAGLEAGTVDIVIGTHRLLQSDVRFKNLGLAILDEEHRFGVRQKERLKQLRSEVDILNLTATPIPRTLNMALSGLRDISIIATAPEQRLSIKTFICDYNKHVIREACLREIRRGGQVYFLHNEVRTMEKALQALEELVPEAQIRMAHGQLPEQTLERIMLDFYHQRFNILLCSTIIESGIDVPTANTIIMERADKFGLAQLHQLRGRVGRSHRRAYAYLLIPSRGVITEQARKRLDAIAALEDLGAGFALASHDLEIRGAGELLGDAQSGEINEVGFALYAELLDRAVKSMQAGRALDMDATGHSGTEINIHAPALLPEDYLPDVHMRLVLYKRIASAGSQDELDELREETIDRFGLLPEATKLLFKITALKILASPLGIFKIDAGPKGARVDFQDKPNIDPSVIIQLLQSAPKRYRLDGPTRLRAIHDMPNADDRITFLRELLTTLAVADHQ